MAEEGGERGKKMCLYKTSSPAILGCEPAKLPVGLCKRSPCVGAERAAWYGELGTPLAF